MLETTDLEKFPKMAPMLLIGPRRLEAAQTKSVRAPVGAAAFQGYGTGLWSAMER